MKFSNKIAVALSLLLGLQSSVMFSFQQRKVSAPAPVRAVSDDQKRKRTDMYKNLLNDYFGARLSELVRNLEFRKTAFKDLKDLLGTTLLSYKDVYGIIQDLMRSNPDVAEANKKAVFEQFQGVMQAGAPIQNLEEIRVEQIVTIEPRELGEGRLPLLAPEQKALTDAVSFWFNEGDLLNFFVEGTNDLKDTQVQRAFNHINTARIMQSNASVNDVIKMIKKAIVENTKSKLNEIQEKAIVYKIGSLLHDIDVEKIKPEAENVWDLFKGHDLKSYFTGANSVDINKDMMNDALSKIRLAQIYEYEKFNRDIVFDIINAIWIKNESVKTLNYRQIHSLIAYINDFFEQQGENPNL